MQVPFGLRDGRLWSPLEVARGVQCGCQCPGCGSVLVARPGTGRRRPHFAHLGEVARTACFESAVHRCAKQVLIDAPRLWLPDWDGAQGMPNPPEVIDDDGDLHRGEVVDWPGRWFAVRKGRTEVAMGELRPDVVLEGGEGHLLVEVRVTHPVGPDKAVTVRRRGFRMVELDLSACPRDGLAEPSTFRDWVLEGAPRHWIWEPEAAAAWQRNADALAEQIACEVIPLVRTSDPMDWEAFRRLFEVREIVPISRPPVVVDPLVGCWVWLDGEGVAEVVQRLTRSGGVYRVRLEDGRARIVCIDVNSCPSHEPGLASFHQSRVEGAAHFLRRERGRR